VISLVTGGAGFIGSHLCDHLISKGSSVIVVDDFSTGDLDNLRSLQNSSKLTIVNGSILDNKLISDLVKKSNFCYHLAASVGVDNISRSPLKSLEINIKGSDVVLGAAADVGIKTLLASSSEVYGKNPNMPLSEESDRVLGSPQVARWSYSEAKAMDELHAFELFKHKSFPVSIARFFNTVGPRQSGSYGMVLPRFVKAAISNQPLTVYGDGTQSRTFCSVRDVVDALVLLMDSKQSIGQAFNIGSTNEITITELAQKVIKLTDSSSEIVYKKHSEVFGDNFEEPKKRVPDISKIKKVLGWQPKQSLDEVIVEIAEYLNANDA
jgi:UDP-glucose 4-epimerase